MFTYKLGIVMLGCMLLAACAGLPKKFAPQTPDEQAVARTMEAYLTAFRARDFETLNTLLAPDATITSMDKGFVVKKQSYREAMREGFQGSYLWHAASIKWVNFRQPDPDSASIEIYIETSSSTRSLLHTTNIHWDLGRRAGEWRILRSIESTTSLDLAPKKSGP